MAVPRGGVVTAKVEGPAGAEVFFDDRAEGPEECQVQRKVNRVAVDECRGEQPPELSVRDVRVGEQRRDVDLYPCRDGRDQREEHRPGGGGIVRCAQDGRRAAHEGIIGLIVRDCDTGVPPVRATPARARRSCHEHIPSHTP